MRHLLPALLAILLLAEPAHAQIPIQSEYDALAEDAGAYARIFDVSIDVALRRLVAQQVSVAATDALARTYADRLAGIVIDHGEPYRIVVSLTGDAPVPDQVIHAGSLDVPVQFTTGAGATRAAIIAAIAAHQAELRAALANPPGMGVDPRTGRLVVMVKSSDIADAGADALAARFSAIAGVPVEIRSLGSLDSDLALEGGGRLIGPDPVSGRRNLCTAGFVATDGARTAIATAAHCPDSLFDTAPGRPDVALTMIGAWGARYQDVQLHTASEPMAPLFLVGKSPPVSRSVTSWRNRDSTRVGDFVCHRGERTGYSCATVAFVDFAPAGDLCAGPCPPTWVAVRGPDCGRGDSGGPVFSRTTAFGLMKGASFADEGTCQLYYYMSTDYLPPGWTLLHTGPVAAPATIAPTAEGAPLPR